MKNDITRDTFDPAKNFSRVLMQQGRVQLDADWNEQVSILLNYLRTLTRDLIGPGAGPEAAWGFSLLVSESDINALPLATDDKNKLIERRKTEQVLIAPGRYYVDGLLAENGGFAAPDPALTTDVTSQKGQAVLIYLDVWERHITSIEDDYIREKALGGPDTATRAKIEWKVRTRYFDNQIPPPDMKLSPPPTGTNLENLRKQLHLKFDAWSEKQLANRPFLRAGIEQQTESDDPCVSSPESVYRGVENQLYRVEIHRPGPAWDGQANTKKGAATFKWSCDNGSVTAAWLDDEDDVLKVAGTRDQVRGFARGQWVELSDEPHDLQGTAGTLVQLKEIETGSLTIDPATANGSVLGRTNFGANAKVRRWDQKETEEISMSGGAIPIQYETWFALEDGVQVQFKTPDGKEPDQFRSGDYWLIPARYATRDIEWPWESDAKQKRRALPPHGIKNHYALLGLLAAATGATFEFTDLRRKFAPLTAA